MTLKCNEEANKIHKSITRFVLPLGMTLHMNGAALYYSMVVLFVAQMQGMTIGFQQSAVICISCVLMSMAFAGLPFHGGTIVNFLAACAIIGIPNPIEILVYIMTIDIFMYL